MRLQYEPISFCTNRNSKIVIWQRHVFNRSVISQTLLVVFIWEKNAVYVCMSSYRHFHHNALTCEGQKSVGSPGVGFPGWLWTACWECWVLNSGPLKELHWAISPVLVFLHGSLWASLAWTFFTCITSFNLCSNSVGSCYVAGTRIFRIRKLEIYDIS